MENNHKKAIDKIFKPILGFGLNTKTALKRRWLSIKCKTNAFKSELNIT